MSDSDNPMVPVDRHMLSRLLYTNPVCLLTVANEAGLRNIMTISWLTAIDNHGHFVASINPSRHTFSSFLREQDTFVLNVATEVTQDIVVAVGCRTGKTTDKFEELEISVCAPGTSSPITWPPEASSTSVPLLAIPAAAAHLVCRIQERQERHGHSILFCVIEKGYARRHHWDGKNLGSSEEPLLSFLGTKRFASMVPQDKIPPEETPNSA